MTYLTRSHNQFFNDMLEDFFQPTFTRKVNINSQILADKENYSIWELPNGMYEVRVQYSGEASTYHRATTRKSLEEAETYVEEQVTYHSRIVQGPRLVKSYKDGGAN